ncbi:MAG TPA: MATE family efflux transporter [Firmicutes bacterium]|nr:MATE family efflux transporter [Bacillota bacterium]
MAKAAQGSRPSELSRRIWYLAWPAILEMGLHMLVEVVDTAMVGRLGARELAAVALGGRVVFSVIFVFAAVGTGAAALVARAVGAADREEAQRTAAQAVTLAFLLGLIMAVGGRVLAGPLFRLTQAEPAVQRLAREYLGIVILSSVLMLPLFVVNALLRSAGDTRTPLILAAFTNSLNIAGDYVLIFGGGPFPALGVRGAAVATAGAQLAGALAALALVFSGRGAIQVRPARLLTWDAPRVRRILRLGTPAALEELTYTVSSLALLFLVSRLGTVSLAAHQVALTVEGLSFMPGWGFAIAAGTLSGQYLGARDPEVAFQSGWLTARYCLRVMGSMGLVFFLAPRFLAGLFTAEPDVAALAAACIRIGALEQVPIAFEMVLSGSLRGAGDTRFPFLVSAFGNWVFRLPLVYLITVVWVLPVWSVWVITVLDWLIRAGLLFTRYRGRRWIAARV